MENIKKEEIFRKIIQLSWPILIANNVINAAALFDLFLVGKLGISQLAAISIAGLILSVYLTIQGGMMSGAIAVVARFLGGKKHEDLKKAIAQIFIFAFSAAGVFSISLYAFMEQVLSYFGAAGETLIYASSYLPVMLLSLMAMSVFFMFVAIVRASGDSVTPLKLMGLASVINIALDPFLIFGIWVFPELGIKGAAIANFTGFIIVDIIALYMLLKGRAGIKFALTDLKFDTRMMARYLRISVPAMGQGLIDRASYMIILKLIAGYGDPFIAAFGIVNRLMMFLRRFGWPIGNSGGVIVAHQLGGGKKENVVYTVKESLKLYTYITALFSVLFFVFAGQVASFFTGNPEAIAYGRHFLMIFSPSFILMGAGVIMFTTFNSAGATGIPLIINIIALYIVQIPLAVMLPRFIGESGIFWAVSAGVAAHGIISLLFLKFSRWMEKRI